ncbi:MAG: extracellular solute-binding protein [Pseudomonadota bacterium]
MILRAFLFIAIFFYATNAVAQETDNPHALSMVGQSQYDKNSTHLSYANPDAPQGGILKQAAIGTFDTLNPFSIKGNAAQGLNLTTDRLMARVWDEPFTLVPLIAAKAEMPEDRSSITFTLDSRAKFHDGNPITHEDVLFSFETLKEHGRPNMRRLYKLARPETIDSQTIKFSFADGYDRETGMIFAMMPVLSKAYWEGKEFDTTTIEPPLGSGPYKIAEVDIGKRVVLQKVENYWAKDSISNAGHHNFDQIIYDYYRDDTVAFESFKKGDLNYRREWDAGDWNNRYEFPALNENKATKEEIKHGRANRVRGFIFNTRRAPFDDIKVRKALAQVLDFDWINKNLFYDSYKQINSFYPNTDLGYSTPKDTRDQRAKMREATKLLKEAGWVVQDGKRINQETNEPVSFEILLDDPGQEKLALSYTRKLQKLGIEANVRVMDTAAFRARLNEYDFDMTLYYWNSTLSPGTEQYLYWSCESAETHYRWNYAGICDSEIDDLAKKIPGAKTREELTEMTQNLDKKLQEGTYFVPLYYNPYDYVAYWNTIQRPETTPLYGVVIETWWANQEDQP